MTETTQHTEAYDVQLSPRGFDVRCIDGDQAVYSAHSRTAARLVADALNEGHITLREAVRLPSRLDAVLDALGCGAR